MSNLDRLLENNHYMVLTDRSNVSDFKDVFVTDLLSTAIKHIKPDTALITVISTQSTLALAQMVDIKVLIFTQDAEPTPSFIEKGNQLGLTFIKTDYLSHEVLKDIYKRGVL